MERCRGTQTRKIGIQKRASSGSVVKESTLTMQSTMWSPTIAIPQARPMPPNTQFTAYGNSSFIFNGGEDASHPPPPRVGPEVGSASQQELRGRRLERSGDRARGGAPAASPESIEGAAGSRSQARAELWSEIEIGMRESKTLGI
ncbi:unnamed protein product [Miscanthus lutarioriparius]|uniref:Uncharacterized protein n=1 Tax=Miscanthus lutarioriparius TaxID=422564 RepID=A0A811SJF2_9POAL|nr:unnamed protein product [Miscanthus lutarioriparius]